jgi:hypothetical protein
MVMSVLMVHINQLFLETVDLRQVQVVEIISCLSHRWVYTSILKDSVLLGNRYLQWHPSDALNQACVCESTRHRATTPQIIAGTITTAILYYLTPSSPIRVESSLQFGSAFVALKVSLRTE